MLNRLVRLQPHPHVVLSPGLQGLYVIADHLAHTLFPLLHSPSNLSGQRTA